jgi:hypothetical protein
VKYPWAWNYGDIFHFPWKETQYRKTKKWVVNGRMLHSCEASLRTFPGNILHRNIVWQSQSQWIASFLFLRVYCCRFIFSRCISVNMSEEPNNRKQDIGTHNELSIEQSASTGIFINYSFRSFTQKLSYESVIQKPYSVRTGPSPMISLSSTVIIA